MDKAVLLEQADHHAPKKLTAVRLVGGMLFVVVVVLGFLIAIFV